ncbi:TPA: F0F1 ATP synthase subunit A [Candidatus Bipolaricaulota bacterium]|nr:F0F1 ATP synthase subunit A [Candidatus Bipolaricaulota bacterium]
MMGERLGQVLVVTIRLGDFALSFNLVTVLVSWIVMLILILGALLLRRGLRPPEEEPTRRQAMLEMVIGAFQRQLGGFFRSPEMALRLFPIVTTIFLFVLLSNWISIIPGLSSPTADLNVTLSLGLMVFFLSHYYGMRRKGPLNYAKEFIEPKTLFPLSLFLNLAGEMAKPISHSFRLFGNVLGGGILAAVISSFIPIIFPALVHGFYDLFIGTVQAFIFALLAMAYIGIAVEG